MAQKRMFSLQVVDTDKFMDMSVSAQALYFHLGMHGDDDGFVASPRKIAKSAGCNDDDLRLLISKGYILPFDSGIVVIADWNINNTLKNDRYHETVFLEEKSLLAAERSGRYVLGTKLEPGWNQSGTSLEPGWNQSGTKLEPEHNVTKPNPTEHSGTECGTVPPTAAPTPVRRQFIPPNAEQVAEYVRQRGSRVDPQGFVDFYESKGWMIGKTPMKDWKAACRNAEHWERWKLRADEEPVPIRCQEFRTIVVDGEEVDVPI